MSTISLNQFNTENSYQRNDDETTFEQVYQFDQYQDGIPINTP